MGNISRGQRGHHGTADPSRYRDVGYGPVVLPVFGSNFDGHGVMNPRRPNMMVRFSGESRTGWGVHSDGVIDCLNARHLERWVLGSDPDGWGHLWGLEASIEEAAQEGSTGVSMLLERLIVRVNIVYTGVIFVPDPAAWAVLIPMAPRSLSGAHGLFVPRPATDPAGAEVRLKMSRKRAWRLKNCP